MVVLNESLQIIDTSMEDNVVVCNRGGGSIVNHRPLFSTDGKYVYILCGWCVSAYSVHTGEYAYQFVTESKEDLVCFTSFGHRLLAVTAAGNVSVWRENINIPEKCLKLQLQDGSTVMGLHPVTTKKKNVDASHTNFDLVVAVKDLDEKDFKLYLFSGTKGNFKTNLYVRAEDKPHSLSVCDEFFAAIKYNRLTVYSFGNTKKVSMLASQGRWWTVVACAPEARGMAAGDNTGRVLYWPQPLVSQAKAVFHWHTLPISAITFSVSGSYMYTGGGEGVMVRWNVEVSNVRNFLPRLPAPIVHLSVSPDNQYVAVSTKDNGIQLVDAQNRVCSVIQRLAWGVNPVAGAALFPAGLVWDPRSRSIVLNGRPGHLQFFSTDENKLLYNLDITGQNYLTQERHKEVINAEVTHVAVSHDGKWMVTVEMRDDHDAFLEVLLKFWQYKFNARQFSLNTCIQLPHQGRIHTVKFQPPGTVLDHYLLITTGADCKFRVWVPSLSESIYREGLHWVCDSVGYFRAQPAECAAFSADGSVLAVTFRASVTLWDVETCQLKTSLTRDNRVLKAVEFGSRECSHLVVTASDSTLNVWSILTLSVIWSVSVHTNLLCADLLTSNMAVFTVDNSVYVFSPSNSKPLYEKRNICRGNSSVMAAIFVPRSHIVLDSSASWCADSQLHFIDSNQELQYLELGSKQVPEQSNRESAAETASMTPFSVLKASQSISEVKRPEDTVHVQFGTSGDVAIRKLLSSPAHTMPHIHLFCGNFLKSLTIIRQTEEAERQKESEEVLNMEVEGDSDSNDTLDENFLSSSMKGKYKKNSKQNTILDQSPTKEISETPSRKKQRRKPKRGKKIVKKKENSFSFDDLDTNWLSVLEKT